MLKTYIYQCICHDPVCRIIYTEDERNIGRGSLIAPIFHSNEIYYYRQRFNPMLYIRRIKHVLFSKEFEFVYDVILEKKDALDFAEKIKNRKNITVAKIFEDNIEEESILYSIENVETFPSKMFKFHELFSFILYGAFKKLLVIHWYEDDVEIRLENWFN